MRLGGAFPLSIPDLINGGGQCVLPSGAAFYPPAGNYLAFLGAVTMLQFFDPVGQQWRSFGAPDQDYLLFDTDGFNWRLVNLSGVVTGASITTPGTGGVNGIGTGTGVNQTTATVTFAAPASPGRTATGYPVVGGAVVAPTVAQAGTGFLEPPLVVIDPPPFGGYLVAPNFWLIPQTAIYQGAALGNGQFLPGPLVPPGTIQPANSPTGVVPVFTAGTGALLNAASLTGSGTLTAIVMVDPGSFYTGTAIPAVTITGVTSAAATAVMSMSMTGATSIVAGTGYTGAAPIFETSLGVVTLRLGNNVFQPRAARGTTTLSGGGLLAVVIEDPGFGFQKVPQGVVINAGSVSTLQSTFVVTVGGITDVSMLYTRVCS